MDIILPTIGSSGYFKLSTPFDTVILTNERYTCQAIRRLSEYLANNENPLEDIYRANGLSDNDYNDDLKENSYIVSLQATTGHWVYVPAKYITQLPVVNGIPYRSMMIGVALPAMPADRDLSHVRTDIENLIMDSLGVQAVTKVVETSKVLLVTKEKHDITQATRDAAASGRLTDRSRYMTTLIQLNQALQKIEILEAYIEQNNI